ncbi:DUF4167 domain-containing protein, partial [Sphingomonas sp. AR_OL41]|nr:DUF4167 domain-containing protein [Sphingomonas sp. AR_OL41]
EQPRRRGRPRREEVEAPAAFDAALLPPALTVSASDGGDEAPAEAPRKRGRPRSIKPAETPAS